MEENELVEQKEHFEAMERAGQINLFEDAYKHEKSEAINKTVESIEIASVGKNEEETPLQKAVSKLKAEMSDKKNQNALLIGQYILDYLESHPEEAEKALAEGKTIKGSLDAMRKEAEKYKNGNFAMLTDEQGLAAVFNYFGFEGQPVTASSMSVTGAPHIQANVQSTVNVVSPVINSNVEAATIRKFEASLDEFL